MKWKQFTEDENGNPKITSETIVRFIHTKKVLCEAKSFIEQYPHRINTLEWLDESEDGWIGVKEVHSAAQVYAEEKYPSIENAETDFEFNMQEGCQDESAQHFLNGVKWAENRKWTSCANGLPDVDGDYIVWCDTYNNKIPIVDVAKWSCEHKIFAKAVQPTHWMPLPQPPHKQ